MMTNVETTTLAQPKTKQLIPAVFGLILALGSPTILIFLASYVKLTFIGAELFFWVIALLILLLVVLWERKPLSSIGFKRFTLKDTVHALLLSIAVLLSFPLIYFFIGLLKLEMATETIKAIGSLPVPVLVLLALRAGVTEEILYRGFSIERLLPITKNKFVAAFIPLLVFVISHLGWGLAHLAFVVVAGTLFSLFYLWKRNLWLNIFSHFMVDITLFLLVPYWL